MVTLIDKSKGPASAGPGSSYSSYQEPDTRVPPKARPVLKEISVNGVPVPESEILSEAQNHPADTPGGSVLAAARALVVRELLLQRARALELAAAPRAEGEGRRETEDDALVRTLLEREIESPVAGEAECRRFYENHPSRFRSGTIHEAHHILLLADPADKPARDAARRTAEELTARLRARPGDFERLARECSACPSAAQGGNLGQLTRGSTVPEFEKALEGLREGATTAEPVASRYGFHIIRLHRRVEGELLPFEYVRERIASWLEASVWSKAVAQYIAVLAGEARITGIDMGGADGPLLQ